MTESLIKESADDIQGNVVGFNKDHQRLLFFTMPSLEAARAFLVAVLPEVSHARDVLLANREHKHLVQTHQDTTSLRNTWSNLLLTAGGLGVLQAPGLDAFPAAFRAGMRERASLIGDQGPSAPSMWPAPFDGSQPVHAMAIVAADDPDDADERASKIVNIAAQAGVQLLGAQPGDTRPDAHRGHEHFGFKDGISQPGIKGWTHASKGGDQIAAGEFVIGYPNQDGAISGQEVQSPAPEPGEPGYPGPGSTSPSLPPWAHNGSFVVYRRLQQDVAGFRQFLSQQAGPMGLTADQFSAKLIGRWPSGAPLEHLKGLAPGTDFATVDASSVDERVLDDDHINKFEYQQADTDGHAVPRAAHIRKSYPRNEEPPGEIESQRHRILRRGITYGPEVVEGDAGYGQMTEPDTSDRGLLFICYQADIEKGFEFIQTQWVNKPDFPQASDGVDPVIAQSSGGQLMPVPGHGSLTLTNWVTTRGGDYFFAPSISALGGLGNGTL